MSIRINARMSGADEVMATLLGLSKGGAARAYAKALNDVGFEGRRALQEELRSVFNKPTRHIVNSSWVKKATADNLAVTIAPTYEERRGTDPQKILQAQEYGGSRRDKRSEVAMKRRGILPNGCQVALPDPPFPGSVDQHGNVKQSFLIKLLAYLSVLNERENYKANMTASGRERVHKGSKGRGGQRFFVSHGSGGSSRFAPSHLAAGIWVATGSGMNRKVRPILWFIRGTNYKPRMSMERVAKKADLGRYLDRRIRFRFREAAGV